MKEGYLIVTQVTKKAKQEKKYVIVRGNEFALFDGEPKDTAVKPKKLLSLDDCTVVPMEGGVHNYYFSFN